MKAQNIGPGEKGLDISGYPRLPGKGRGSGGIGRKAPVIPGGDPGSRNKRPVSIGRPAPIAMGAGIAGTVSAAREVIRAIPPIVITVVTVIVIAIIVIIIIVIIVVIVSIVVIIIIIVIMSIIADEIIRGGPHSTVR